MLRQPVTRVLKRSLSSLRSSPRLPLPFSPTSCRLKLIQEPLQLPRPHLHQQSRGLFSNYRRRVRHERETGNWASLQIPIVAAILTTTVGLLLIVYGYTKYQEWSARTLHNYPPSVAKQLRRALYYAGNPGSSSYSPKDALRHFISALENAREEGMHPLSKEVTGIKIEIARVCEECGRRDKAVEVLNEVWASLRKGLKIWDEKIKEGGEGLEKLSVKVPNLHEQKDILSQEGAPDVVNPERKKFELEQERTGLVRRVIEIGIKLGSLLIDDWNSEQNQNQAVGEASEKQRKQDGEKVLEFSIKTIIEEQQRRLERTNEQKELPSVTENRREDGWLTPVEIASAFEILATHYLTTHKPNLAIPLLLHAIHTLYPPPPHQTATEIATPSPTPTPLADSSMLTNPTHLCHAATLMNTISAAISELPPSTSDLSTSPPRSTSSVAEHWATLALKLTNPSTSSGDPNLAAVMNSEECIQARIVARINLSELLAQRGDVEAARKGFENAKREARRVAWEEGVERVEMGIRGLEQKQPR